MLNRFAAVLAFSVAASAVCVNDTLRVQSYNLRNDAIPNSISVATTISGLNDTVPADSEMSYYSLYAEQPWSTRRLSVVAQVMFHQPVVLCVQEAKVRQVQDLAGMLDGYEYIGVGRDDGKTAGEYSAIFYKSCVFFSFLFSLFSYIGLTIAALH